MRGILWDNGRAAAAKLCAAFCSLQLVLLKVAGAWALFFLATYLLVWLALIPTLGRSLAARALADLLARPVTIERLRFNPLTLSIRVEGFAIRDKDGGELFSFSRFLAEPQALDLLAGRLSVKNILLENPRIRLARAADGAFNIADLLSTPEPTQEDAQERTAQVQAAAGFQFPADLPISLENLALVGGRIDFDDRLTNSSHAVTDLNFSLPLLRFKQSDAANELDTRGAVDAAPVSARVAVRLGPAGATIDAEASIRSFKLRRYAAYLPGPQTLDVDVDEAVVNAEATFVTAANGAYAAPTARVSLRVAGVEARDQTGEPFFKIASLRLEDAVFDLNVPQPQDSPIPAARIGRVVLESPWLRAQRLPNGAFVLPGLVLTNSSLVKAPDQKADAPAESLSGAKEAAANARPRFTPPRLPAFPLRIESIELADGRLVLEQLAPRNPATASPPPASSMPASGAPLPGALLKVDAGRLLVRGLDCAAWRVDAFEVGARSDFFESLTLTGAADLSTLSGRATLALKDLALERLAALLPLPDANARAFDPARLTRLSGKADLRASVNAALKDGDPQAALSDGEFLLRELDLELDAQRLQLGQLHLAGLGAQLGPDFAIPSASLATLSAQDASVTLADAQPLTLGRFELSALVADLAARALTAEAAALHNLSLSLAALGGAPLDLTELRVAGLNGSSSIHFEQLSGI